MIVTDRLACSNPACTAEYPLDQYFADLDGKNGDEAALDALLFSQGKGCPTCHFGLDSDVPLEEARRRIFDFGTPAYPYREKKREVDEDARWALHNGLMEDARSLEQAIRNYLSGKKGAPTDV